MMSTLIHLYLIGGTIGTIAAIVALIVIVVHNIREH
jgi:hypothetical protein